MQIKDFREKPSFIEDNRDAVNHEIGILHFFRSSDSRHHVKAGYFYDKEIAKGDNWDYWGNKFVAGIQYTLPTEIKFTADYEYKELHYEHETLFLIIFAGGKRKDREENITAALSKNISKNLGVSLEYLRSKNRSNIFLYSYEKNLYSTGITWKW